MEHLLKDEHGLIYSNQETHEFLKANFNMDPEEPITDGSVSKNAIIVAKLSETSWDYYPYMDTMCYISTGRDIVTNQEKHPGVDRVARDTGGDYEYVDEDEDY